MGENISDLDIVNRVHDSTDPGADRSAQSEGRSRRRRLARRVVIAAAVVFALAVTVAAVVGLVQYRSALRKGAGELAFENEMAIPPLVETTTDAAGRTVFDLTVESGTEPFVGRGCRSRHAWREGRLLGPYTAGSRGQDVQTDVANQLGEITTMRWCGMHLPAAMRDAPTCHRPDVELHEVGLVVWHPGLGSGVSTSRSRTSRPRARTLHPERVGGSWWSTSKSMGRDPSARSLVPNPERSRMVSPDSL